jgi:hypothetical protein
MPDLGLPDPADYNAPTNWDATLVHPSVHRREEFRNPYEELEDDETVGPFPPDAPTVSGDEITVNVNQRGESSP